MHESHRLSKVNRGHELRRVETPPATHASAHIAFSIFQLIYNACFGTSPARRGAKQVRRMNTDQPSHKPGSRADFGTQTGRPLSCFSSLSWLRIFPRFPMAHRIPQGRDRQRRAMQLIRWHTIQRLDHVIGGQLAASLDRPPHDQFRQRRPTSDRRPAADRVVLRRRNSTALDSQIQDHERTAAWCARVPGQAGIRHHPAVPRRHHMIHHHLGVFSHRFVGRSRF